MFLKIHCYSSPCLSCMSFSQGDGVDHCSRINCVKSFSTTSCPVWISSLIHSKASLGRVLSGLSIRPSTCCTCWGFVKRANIAGVSPEIRNDNVSGLGRAPQTDKSSFDTSMRCRAYLSQSDTAGVLLLPTSSNSLASMMLLSMRKERAHYRERNRSSTTWLLRGGVGRSSLACLESL